jgi:hypothetical protein
MRTPAAKRAFSFVELASGEICEHRRHVPAPESHPEYVNYTS